MKLWIIFRLTLILCILQGVDQAHACVEQLLKAIWHAEFLCRFGLYRTAIILLADIGLEFGMTKWCRKIIDEIMPQVKATRPLTAGTQQ